MKKYLVRFTPTERIVIADPPTHVKLDSNCKNVEWTGWDAAKSGRIPASRKKNSRFFRYPLDKAPEPVYT